jgi:hypothetical protein
MAKNLSYRDCCFLCEHWVVQGKAKLCTLKNKVTDKNDACISYKKDANFLRAFFNMATPEQLNYFREQPLTKEDYYNDSEY